MSFMIDLTPLRRNTHYRNLFLSQLISFFGTAIAQVSTGFFAYQITKSSLAVGLIGVFSLVPLSISGFIGGAWADRFNRKKIIIYTELALAANGLFLMLFALSSSHRIEVLYLLVAINALITGIHRPALESYTQQIIKKEEIPAVAALGGFRYTFAMIIAPSIGGLVLANFGLWITFLIDMITYLVSLAFVLQLPVKLLEKGEVQKKDFTNIVEGLQFLKSQPVILGTYMVDIIAMLFVFPSALYPAMAEKMGSPQMFGFLHSALAVGALISTVTSGWLKRFHHHGRAVAFAAIGWSLALASIGFTETPWLILALIAVAGYFDMISGIFRGTIWNERIPQNFRGRLAGLEMLSYMAGPLLGGALMGWSSEHVGIERAFLFGGTTGALCLLGVLFWLRAFWNYRAESATKVLN
jgi:MFS family permease